jgi:hypothetical protein
LADGSSSNQGSVKNASSPNINMQMASSNIKSSEQLRTDTDFERKSSSLQETT